MEKIEFLNLSHYFSEDENAYMETFKKVMKKGHYILGEEVSSFEKEFSELTGSSYTFGTGNGLDAITIALKALDIGAGDEVIVPAHTFIATWLAVSFVGATLKPVEVDETTMNIDVQKVEQAISSRTKAVIGVHLYGRPCEAVQLRALCDKKGIHFIEDAAQAHGAQIDGKNIGSIGHAATFSFYPGKNLGAYGDAGATCTSSSQLAQKIKMLRNYGSQVKYHHEMLGMNSRLDEMLAAFLRLRLRKLQQETDLRNSMASLYHTELSGVSELQLPNSPLKGTQVWHLYVVRTPERDALATYLNERGVQTLIHYPIPCHLSGCYSSLGFKEGQFPITESISKTVLSLPIGPHLDEAKIKAVASHVKSFFT